MSPWVGLALGYHVLSRLAYAVGVGAALRRQEREQIFTRLHGVEAGFRRFRWLASAVMNNDAVSFVVLCLATRNTLWPNLEPLLRIAGAVTLIALGIGIKAWAARNLGGEAYYWHNFFTDDDPVPTKPSGPYRYLKNPMYTVGYAHAYGAALLLASRLGLLAAVFDQVAILMFYVWVEQPHFERLIRRDLHQRPAAHVPEKELPR